MLLAQGVTTRVFFVGDRTAEPELRTTGQGTPFTLFRLAGPGAAGSNGPPPDDTPYCRAMLWGNVTEAAHAHLAQGHRVRVDGRREHRTYTNPAIQHEHRLDRKS